METPHRQNAQITLGEKTYPVQFEYFNIAFGPRRLKEQGYGDLFSLGQLMAIDSEQADLLQLAALVFVGICHNDPALKFDDVAAWINWGNIGDIKAVVETAAKDLEAKYADRFKPDEKAEDGPVPLAPSGGDSTSPSPESTSD